MGEHSNLYPISIDGEWGFIDSTGAVVIEPQFLRYSVFSEGLASVAIRRLGRIECGFIDQQGLFVIGPGAPPGVDVPEDFIEFYRYEDFSEDRAVFWVGDAGGLGGYIDRTGALVIPPIYKDVEEFSDGVACVTLAGEEPYDFDQPSGVIDPSGKFVIEPKRRFIGIGFAEGRCSILRDESCALINKKGKLVVPWGVFDAIGDFYNGRCRVVTNGKVGAIDRHGALVIPLEFDQLWEFHDEDLTSGEKDGKCWIVDRAGKCVREIDVGSGVHVGRLRNGMASAYSKTRGYVNSEGQLKIPMQFDHAEEFKGDLAFVKFGKYSGYVNKDGEIVWRGKRW